MSHDHAVLHLLSLAKAKNKQSAEDAAVNAAHRAALAPGQQAAEMLPPAGQSSGVPLPATPSLGAAVLVQPSTCGTTAAVISGSGTAAQTDAGAASVRVAGIQNRSSPRVAVSPLPAPATQGIQDSPPLRPSTSRSSSNSAAHLDLTQVQYWRRRPSNRAGVFTRLVTPAVVQPQLFGLRQQLGMVDYWPKQVRASAICACV